MCNQITIATNMIGICEALVYAENAGLIPIPYYNRLLRRGWFLVFVKFRPRILNGDYEPGFFVRHFVKDMDIALKEAKEMQIELPGLKLARRMYHELNERGFGEQGTQVLYKSYN